MTVAQEVRQGSQSSVGLYASTLVKAAPGRVSRVVVTTAGAAGALYDCATIAGAGSGNLIATVPATIGVIFLDFPFLNGLVYVPGLAQVVSISWS